MASVVLELVGNTLWLRVKGVTIDDGSGPVAVTSAGQFDTFTAQLREEDGTAIGSPIAMALSTNPSHPTGTWQARFNVPNLPGENVSADAVLVDGTSQRTYEGVVRVKG